MVTATKREESVQDVPLAITALSGEFTREVNLNDVKDLVSFTPGVTGNSQDSFIDAISVRGIRTQDFGVGGDPSAAFFKNDLYEGRNGSAVTSLYDMARSEVLRGPQGFLFGRNSIGGAFSVHTARAEIDGGNSGYIELDAGEDSRIAGEGAVNVPVNDHFAMRFAGYFSTEDGFAKNVFNGRDVIEHDKSAVRWSTTHEKDALSVYTMLEYESRKQSGSMYRAVDRGDIWETFVAATGASELSGSDEDIDSDQSGGDADDADILTLGVRFDYDFENMTLTSNTGYKDHDYFYSEDYDGTPLNINNYGQDQAGDYFQQEFRLTSDNDGPFSWYAGVSFYKESIDALFTFSGEEDFFCQYYGYYYNDGMTFSGCADLYAYYSSPFTPSADGLLTETGRIVGDYSGWGAYVDLSFAASDTLDFSIGARWTDDEKDFSINVPPPDSDLGAYWAYTFATEGAVSEKRSWDDTTLRFVARYRPTPTALLFGSFTEGFKSGGFGSFALVDSMGDGVGGGDDEASQARGDRPNAFNPETVDSLEFGYKDTFGQADVAVTAFLYDYKDLQVVVFDGGAAKVENVGQVDGQGLEASITARLGDNYDLYAAASWLDTEATQLQKICGLDNANGCEGSSLFWAPDFSGALVLNGHWPAANGEWSGGLEMFWESERGGGFENLASTKIGSYTDVSARFGYESNNNWALRLYIENLTDEFTWDGLNNNGGVLPSHFFGPKKPRTIGISYTYRWE
ncbi:MAG: TonB-dependent receptor [Gammaproteobacteria bacterium]|nr:TonB-dependent receptor [Gammaproteobacteria bacterium]NNF61811.1 TonB-dependent receptor [Gammaproteobacteria bacterium]NNM19735.1 TonB-dependent receptor [Gammaproteobacteria bacterium]